MEMPKPGSEHRQLEQMAGIWTSKEKMHPSQWDPKGGTANGHIRNRIALGGFIMTGDYGQEREGKTTFEGHSVFTYDKNERCYLLYWWDSMGMPADVFRGNFEKSNLVMTSRNAMGHFRLTYEFPGPGKMRSKMEMSEDGETWKAMFESESTRTG